MTHSPQGRIVVLLVMTVSVSSQPHIPPAVVENGQDQALFRIFFVVCAKF